MSSTRTDADAVDAAGAALMPCSAALFCAAYALMPARFPADTAQTMGYVLMAELPAMLIGVAHASAVRESARPARFATYGVVIAVLLLAGGLRVLVDLETRFLLPMLGWILLGHLIELWGHNSAPQLAYDRAWAVLLDKIALLMLPTLAAIGVMMIELPLLALAAAVYFALSACSAIYAHGAGFRQHRRRLFKHPLLGRLGVR